MKKNFIFHCYLKNIDELDETTLLHLKCLNKYCQIFDGKKIVYVALDDIRISQKSLLAKINLLEIFDEICIIKNNNDNRESETLIDSLTKIKSNDKSITFYAHNKGSTHSLDSVLKNWILSMYFFNLESEYIRDIEYQLSQNFITSGILKKDCKWKDMNDVSGDWHYSGAFFWFSQSIFEHDWLTFSKGRMSLESYLGQRITTEKAYCTFVNRNYNFHINNTLWDEEINVQKLGNDIMNRFSNLVINNT